MLISLVRTAHQALTFNVDPALLPRWESGPLLLALAAALLSSMVRGAPVNFLMLIALAVLLTMSLMLSNKGLPRSVPRETVALAYLMCVGVLIFNVPAAVIAGLGLAYSAGPSNVLEASGCAGASADSSSAVGPVALVFIVLSLASARPRIRRAFFREDVRTVRNLLMVSAVGRSFASSPSAPLSSDNTDPKSRLERSS